jgi:hypothetical protein
LFTKLFIWETCIDYAPNLEAYPLYIPTEQQASPSLCFRVDKTSQNYGCCF